jgi:hypothetical protein
MYLDPRILRDRKLVLTRETMVRTKDGRLFILTLSRQKPRDSMRSSASTLTDHSTLSLSFHSTELLRALEPITLLSRDGETMLELSNGTSMRFLRPSEVTSGKTMPWTSRIMVTATT